MGTVVLPRRQAGARFYGEAVDDSLFVGFFVACCLALYWHLNNGDIAMENLTLILWPASIMLLSITHPDHIWFATIVQSISVTLNGFIYLGGVALATKLFRAIMEAPAREHTKGAGD